jgi:hypothetical protein
MENIINNLEENIIQNNDDIITNISDIEILDGSVYHISSLHRDRLVNIININKYEYIIYHKEYKNNKKKEKKYRISFDDTKKLLKMIRQKKVEPIELINRIYEYKKIENNILNNILIELFRNYNIVYNKKIIEILNSKKIKLINIKKILIAYANNKEKDILLWNYLINIIILYENNKDIQLWKKIFKSIIKHDNFYEIFTDFIYANDILIYILNKLIIFGEFDTYMKIKKIFNHNKNNIENEIIYKSIKYFYKHQSYETIKYCLDNIKNIKDIETMYGNNIIYIYINSLIKSEVYVLSENEEKTLILLHDKFGYKNIKIYSVNTDIQVSIPIFFLEHRVISYNLFKYYHSEEIKYKYDQYNIYHIIGDLKFSDINIEEILKILYFLLENIEIDMKERDNNQMTPLGYVIKNDSLNYEIIKFFLKYESLYDKLDEKNYLYYLLTNYNITLEIIEKLIEEKYIDVGILNEYNENILMIFTQNSKIFDSKNNIEYIRIIKYLKTKVDIHQKDIDGNNIFGSIILVDNYEIIIEMINIFGYEMLNEMNNKGNTGLFRMIKYNYIEIIEKIINYIIDNRLKIDMILKYNGKQKSIIDNLYSIKITKKIVKYLLETNKDNFINYVNKYGEDHIAILILKVNFDIELYNILNKYIDYERKYWDNYDIFLMACSYCRLSVIKKMIKYANTTHKNNLGENSIISACYNYAEYKIDILKFLISYGIDYKIKDVEGRTLYKILIQMESQKIIDELIDSKSIDIYDDDFINFTFTENIEKYKKIYNINQNIIEYNNSIEECLICKDEIKGLFFKCYYNEEHVYHKECFMKWIQQSKKSACLLCMKNIYFYREIYEKI